MNMKIILLPLVCLLATGCVSKSMVQSMIESNNETVVNPRLDALESRMGESQRLTEQQRQVLIRHFELMGEMSQNALVELKKMP